MGCMVSTVRYDCSEWTEETLIEAEFDTKCLALCVKKKQQ